MKTSRALLCLLLLLVPLMSYAVAQETIHVQAAPLTFGITQSDLTIVAGQGFTVGVPYDGGTPPFVCSVVPTPVTTGTPQPVPSWIIVDSSIQGDGATVAGYCGVSASVTPLPAADYNFTLVVKDSAGMSASIPFIVTARQLPPSQAPTFTPPAGTYTSAQTITLASPTTSCNSSIYWNTTGSPTGSDNNSTQASMAQSGTLYASVIGCPGYLDSPVSNAPYVINLGLTVTDNFNRTTGLGSNWIVDVGTAAIYSNAEFYFSGGCGSTCFAHWATKPNTKDQYAQALLSSMYSTNMQGIAVRMSGTTVNTGYRYQCSATAGCVLVGTNNGSTLFNVPCGTAVVGDTIRIEARGTTITALKNGVAQCTPITNAIVSDGYVGIRWGYGAAPGIRIDNFAGGDLQ